MRIRHALLGAATVAALAACGTSAASPHDAAPMTTTTSAPTKTVAPTSTKPKPTKPKPKPTTTKPKPTKTITKTVGPPTTKPRPSGTATRPPTPRPTTTKPRPVGLAKGTPCKATADACVDLSANQSWLIADGAAVYGPVPITHGQAGWETPPGTFTVGWKNRHHRSSIFNNAPMPYSVFFNGGIAFHQGSLREKSHGCIHLSQAAAARYFSALGVGDTVQVVR
ncbi:L,D-transpeptidase [Actinokineospora sp. 24-640]